MDIWPVYLGVSTHLGPKIRFLLLPILETDFCLNVQVEPTQLDPVDRTSLFLDTSLINLIGVVAGVWRQRLDYHLGPTEKVPHEDGDRIQSLKTS
jgi:hypothetical protein